MLSMPGTALVTCPTQRRKNKYRNVSVTVCVSMHMFVHKYTYYPILIYVHTYTYYPIPPFCIWSSCLCFYMER